MKIICLLADAAQIDLQTKVHALGINWTHMPSPPLPMSVIVVVDLEPEELPAALSLKIELVDSADRPVEVPDPTENKSRTVSIEGVATAPHKEELRRWEPTLVPFVTNIGPGLPLPPGNYAFRIEVTRAGGQTVRDRLRFRVRQPSEG